ncbi:unnamed protein product [Kuraishia capsulata CBS 1993]|uniref:Uncharacterized protein n=1 Tax=Kuraishia capsulata CBS 1993 TaxID=1382522 RepID=W6MJR0_9ASCO|nr:uncharacterized protein KUCA_T00002473001 [Kuraishia capsulata CBS 1993]CDK26501.1 unnamed protein product [Kuraishia capsulata CBS 1993]
MVFFSEGVDVTTPLEVCELSITIFLRGESRGFLRFGVALKPDGFGKARGIDLGVLDEVFAFDWSMLDKRAFKVWISTSDDFSLTVASANLILRFCSATVFVELDWESETGCFLTGFSNFSVSSARSIKR